MGHYVYKYVFNDEIIYIGKNDTDLHSRLKCHGRPGDNISEEGWDEINNSDIFYCILANSNMSDMVESELIRRYKPKYNKAKKSEWSGLNFVEPIWIKYKGDENKRIKELNEQIIALKTKNSFLEKQNEQYKNGYYVQKKKKEYEHEIFVLKKEIEENRKERGYKEKYFELACKYEELLKINYNDCVSDENTYKFHEICKWYKREDSINGVFKAIAYDAKGQPTSCKTIYIDFLGRLYFNFEQINRLPVKGVIYWDKTDKAKKSWSILRSWMNVGTNEYIKTI